MSFGKKEIFREGKECSTHGSVFFLEVYLVGECKEHMTGLDFMADKVDPVAVGAVLDQKEKVIILSVGQVEMGAMPYRGAVDLFDLEKIVAIRADLAKGVMRDILFIPELVQTEKVLVHKGKTTGKTTSGFRDYGMMSGKITLKGLKYQSLTKFLLLEVRYVEIIL